MSHAAATVLLLRLDGRGPEDVGPLLGQAGVRLCATASESLAAELLETGAFGLLVLAVEDGPPSLPPVVAVASRCAVPVLMLLDAHQVGAAPAFLGHGVNRVETVCARPDRLLDAVADLLALAGARRLRRVVQLDVLLCAGTHHELAVTKNVSQTGMLVVGGRRFAIGSRVQFALRLPGDDRRIEGDAEVTRQTNRAVEPVEGVGLRFLRFSEDGRERLQGFLEALREPGVASVSG